MDTNNIHLRRAEERDSGFLFNLRNDDEVRRVSFSSDLVPRENHEKWFAGKLASPQGIIWIVENDANSVGQVRVDCESDTDAEISIALTSACRGKGYGREALRRASAAAFAHYPSLQRIHALIKIDNEMSTRSFQAAGYIFEKDEERKGQSCKSFVLNR